MGEVWRAKDTKLGRDVAIKVLSEEFTRDAERLARFEREARILASLEHSNIASIYGLEEVDGTRFLVMQLAAGEDLSERLSRGVIPIDEAMRGEVEGPVEAASSHGISRRMIAVVAIAALLVGALVAWLAIGARAKPSGELVSLEITGASFNSISPVAISADGKMIAYAPHSVNANALLHVRELGDFVARAVPGTEGARAPFFSPDGRSIGYFDRGRGLYAVGIGGGTPRRIARMLTVGESGTWLPDGRIVGSGIEIDGKRWRGLAVVPGEGGAAIVLTTPGPREREHQHPAAVPGSRWIVFTVLTNNGFSLDAVSLDGKWRHRVVESGSSPQFAPTGHLVFYRAGDQVLVAVPFDRDSARVTGEAIVLQQNVLRLSGGQGAFAVSASGTMIHTPTNSSSQLTGIYSLVLVDRSGEISPLLERGDTWAEPRFSPDGKRLLVRQTMTPDCMLWTIDLDRGTLTRQTFDGDHHSPEWSPDGKEIVASVSTEGIRELRAKGLGGESAYRMLARAGEDIVSATLSRDGRELFFAAGDRLVSVAIEPGEPLRASAPRILFGGKFVWDRADNFDAAPDGQSFVMVQSSAGDGVTEVVRVTLNWSRELEKRFAR